MEIRRKRKCYFELIPSLDYGYFPFCMILLPFGFYHLLEYHASFMKHWFAQAEKLILVGIATNLIAKVMERTVWVVIVYLSES